MILGCFQIDSAYQLRSSVGARAKLESSVPYLRGHRLGFTAEEMLASTVCPQGPYLDGGEHFERFER